jgi:hypothetical protein
MVFVGALLLVLLASGLTFVILASLRTKKGWLPLNQERSREYLVRAGAVHSCHH